MSGAKKEHAIVETPTLRELFQAFERFPNGRATRITLKNETTIDVKVQHLKQSANGKRITVRGPIAAVNGTPCPTSRKFVAIFPRGSGNRGVLHAAL